MANGHIRGVILDTVSGRPLTGVSLNVKLTGTGTNATLFSDRAGTALANPFTNEADGSYLFFADTANRYDIIPSKAGTTFDNTDYVDLEVSGTVSDGTVTAAKIVDGTITDAKIAAGTITDARIAASGITTRSKLPAAIAYEDESNIFTVSQTIQQPASLPSIVLSGGIYAADLNTVNVQRACDFFIPSNTPALGYSPFGYEEVLSGTGSVGGVTGGTASRNGILTFITGATAVSVAVLTHVLQTPHTSLSASIWGIEGFFNFASDNNLTQKTVVFGLSNSTAVGGMAATGGSQGVCFRVEATTAGVNIFAVTKIGVSTETTTDTVIADSNTFRKLTILATSSQVLFFIDGVLKATHTTNIPTVALLFLAGLTNKSASDRRCTIDWVKEFIPTR